MTAPFHVRTILNYGLNNHIVARLSFQILDILEKCNMEPGDRYELQKIYVEQLMPQLIKMWQIESWYKDELNKQIQEYELNVKNGNKNHLPHIPQLEQECHNLLYEYKNFLRNVLSVFNLLYGTDFKEASEFYSTKKQANSLIGFSEDNFGINNPKTKFLKEAETNLRSYISMRNAIEHPKGYSGVFIISNFTLCHDQKVLEPCWWREQGNEKEIDKTSIRMGFEVAIHDLLTLAEDIYISWADEHLSHPSFAQLASIPKEKRDPNCPVKYKVQYHLPSEI